MLKISSPNSIITYTDSEDHFNNGVLRLLSLTAEDFVQWLAEAEKIEQPGILAKLTAGFAKIKQTYPTFNYPCELGPNGQAGNIWHSIIGENPNFGVAKSIDNSLGWLVKLENNSFIREISPPVYEEAYFEGDSSAGGYTDYGGQASWRLEKAHRQVREIINITGLTTGFVLDLGSGYGYLRKALADAGFNHQGIEISKHANAISKKLYNFDSLTGSLSDYKDEYQEAFDLVVLGDMIEHTADPARLLSEINYVLKPGGFVLVKTPNLNCPEAIVFGPHYHSLKREHLVYFTSNSLITYGKKAGFFSHYATSISHLLVGFVSSQQIEEWQNSLQGSDLIVYFKKPINSNKFLF